MSVARKKIIFPNNLSIQLIGNVASGKTTLCKKISRSSNFKYLDIDLYINNPFLNLYVKNPNKWALTTGLKFSLERSNQIAKFKNLLPSPVILDQGFDMGLHVYSKNAYSQNYMTKNEWALLKEVHEKLMNEAPDITATIFLDVPVKILLERIKYRKRYHEKYYTKEYVTQLQKKLTEYKNGLIKSKKNVITISYEYKNIISTGNKYPKLIKLLKNLPN